MARFIQNRYAYLCISMQKNEIRLSIGKAAKFLGVSVDTLRRWEKKGKVTAFRTPGGHRYFLEEDLKRLLNQKYLREKTQTNTSPPVSKTVDLPPQITPTVSLKREAGRASPVQKIFLILLAVFALIDIVLLYLYFSISRTLASPIP